MKILDLIENICLPKERIIQKDRLENIEQTRNSFIKEIYQNELTNKKCQNIFTVLNYIEHFLISASAVSGFVSVSPFASLLDITIGITISPIGLKVCGIIAGIEKYKSIIK